MTNYRNGRDFEWAVRDALIDDGYWVTRSAGSKTKVDLVAVKPGEVLFVQAKRDGKISPAERTALLELAAMLPGVAAPILAYRTGRPAHVVYALLLGPGPKDRCPWIPDEVAA